VLDLEQTNGLAKRQLQAWVAAWLHRVYASIGVRAMIYTSPSFFAASVGDTTWFAKRGYYLWIAHWGVKTPDVPAKDWAGRSWSLWQWTDVGTVSGIDGNVDRDVCAKRHLGSLLIT
jgi:lysozyme